MTDRPTFRELIDQLVARHADTTLGERWEDAQRVDPELKPRAFWIRETTDLINAVWLIHDGVFDITWFPTRMMSTMSFLSLSDIVGIEIKQAPGTAAATGVPVEGDLAVTVTATAQRAGLYWVADASSSDALRAFTAEVLDAYRTA